MASKKLKVQVFTSLCGPYYHIRKGETTELETQHAQELAKSGDVKIIETKKPAAKKPAAKKA